MEDNIFLKFPVEVLHSFDLFAPVIDQYCPGAADDARKSQPFGALLDSCPDREAFRAAFLRAADQFEQITREEVREFGVDLDPHSLRYQWGNPEINDQVVRLIEQSEAPIQTGQIVFYGPSNIALWFSLERDMLPYTAYNHGIGGCIDDDMMHYAPRLLYPYRPAVVFFQTGSNDIASGIPLETILANKKKMYGLFLENMPQAKLVVCSGLPLPGRTQFWDATVETNALLEKMCAETDRLYFLDATDAMLTDHGPDSLRTSDGRYFNPDYYRIDKIHLNKRGHDVWTALMKDKLAEIL